MAKVLSNPRLLLKSQSPFYLKPTLVHTIEKAWKKYIVYFICTRVFTIFKIKTLKNSENPNVLHKERQ